jgi:hypothetical protein
LCSLYIPRNFSTWWLTIISLNHHLVWRTIFTNIIVITHLIISSDLIPSIQQSRQSSFF